MAHFSTLSKQMKHRDRDMVPKVLVQAMFGLMLSAIALVAYDQLSGRPMDGVLVQSPVAAERMITLTGTRSDGVVVYDKNGIEIGASSDDKAGFIDVIWMSVNRERIVQDVTSDAPLRLVRRENGHIAIFDDTTGWMIELIGYGQDNVAAFARLID
ncbi:MAG: photosynthetic complex assembly protein PuhC [Yoonia sp.]|nr:photosynthetic complex assembly protein PuhC [Yoonia sp.]MDG1862264.1 photosynthetic complex assembly protein PuhC [Yoonia sp.]